MTQKNEKKMPRRAKTNAERAIQALVGVGLVYISNSASNVLLHGIMFFGGIGLVLYAILSD